MWPLTASPGYGEVDERIMVAEQHRTPRREPLLVEPLSRKG